MSDMTTTEAMATAPASASKTAILAAADAFVTAINNAITATAIEEDSGIQVRSEFIDALEDLAINMAA